jgi:hypothetical protein
LRKTELGSGVLSRGELLPPLHVYGIWEHDALSVSGKPEVLERVGGHRIDTNVRIRRIPPPIAFDLLHKRPRRVEGPTVAVSQPRSTYSGEKEAKGRKRVLKVKNVRIDFSNEVPNPHPPTDIISTPHLGEVARHF